MKCRVVKRSRKSKSRRQQLRASHQKSWLVGRYAVLEALQSGRWPVDDLYIAELQDQGLESRLLQLATAAGLQFQHVTGERLSELCHAEHHQGVAARMGLFPYGSVDDLPAAHPENAGHPLPLVVVCDGIQDTHNFGAILRCCDAMAVTAVVIGETHQAGVTPQVARSSAGAVNHLQIIRTAELGAAVNRLKASGFTISAASEKASAVASDADLRCPVALVVGSEASGVSPDIADLCDCRLRIPMQGKVESLNAAVAAGILLYEIRRQQTQKS